MPITRIQILLAALLATVGVASSMLLPAPADAGVKRIKPSHTTRQGSLVVYKRVQLAAPAVRSAVLKRGGKRKRVPTTRVRRAAGNGNRLVVRVPQRWVRKAAKRGGRKAMIRKRKRIARNAKLLVKLSPAQTGSNPPPVEPIPPSELRIGLVSNSQGWHMNSQHVLDLTVPSGVKWVREDFDWEVIEPRDDRWRWERYDNLMIQSAARDIRVLPLLMSTPEWAGSAWNEIPADPTEFAEMTAQVVARYGPGGTFWDSHPEIAAYAPEHFEIWNEPYLEYFSAGGVQPARYARLVKAASQAGAQANPAVKFLIEADKGTGSDPRNKFIDRMYEAVPDLNDYFDAVAVHPYASDSAPDEYRDGWGFTRLEAVRERFVAHGGSDKPLWITEVGWSTCPKPVNRDCVSERQQADYTAQMFELLRTKYSSYVDAVFLYRREDLNDNPSDKEGWFGLERLDGSKKPAYDVVRQATGAIGS